VNSTERLKRSHNFEVVGPQFGIMPLYDTGRLQATPQFGRCRFPYSAQIDAKECLMTCWADPEDRELISALWDESGSLATAAEHIYVACADGMHSPAISESPK
jgi:hypothetical protein